MASAAGRILLDSLAPGGLLIYETFDVDQAALGKPSNPDFLLRHGELLERCAALRILAYEDGLLGAPERDVQRIAAVRLTQPDVADAAPLSAPHRALRVVMPAAPVRLRTPAKIRRFPRIPA